MLVHLVPLGHGRHDLYAEPPEPEAAPPSDGTGPVRRWLHKAGEQWRSLVDAARTDTPSGRVARWRDTIICRLADSLEEQRTLWALRHVTAATALFPAGDTPAAARTAINRILALAQQHHGRWLAIDTTLFIASGVLFFVPGPNIVAYYLGFRAFGHLQSWRGARQAAGAVQWTLVPSEPLAELATLAGQPHAVRATRVAAIAAELDLPRLPAFFERAAA